MDSVRRRGRGWGGVGGGGGAAGGFQADIVKENRIGSRDFNLGGEGQMDKGRTFVGRSTLWRAFLLQLIIYQFKEEILTIPTI